MALQPSKVQPLSSELTTRQGRPAWNRLPYGHNASASERQNLNGDDTGPARPPPSFFACGAGRSGRRRDGEDGRPRRAPRARGIVPPSAVTNFRSARGPPPGPDEAEHGGRCTQFEVTTPGARSSAPFRGACRAPSEVLNPMAAPPARWGRRRSHHTTTETQRGGVGPRYINQPTTGRIFSAAVSARAIQANPPADRAYGRPRRRLGPERASLRPSQRAETSGHGAPRATARAAALPLPRRATATPGARAIPTPSPARSPRRGGGDARGSRNHMAQTELLDLAPTGRGRAAGRAPRRSPSATRRRGAHAPPRGAALPA